MELESNLKYLTLGVKGLKWLHAGAKVVIVCLFVCFLCKVADGELKDFHQVLCTLDFLSQMKPLQRILREKMPTTRRGKQSILGRVFRKKKIELNRLVQRSKIRLQKEWNRGGVDLWRHHHVHSFFL